MSPLSSSLFTIDFSFLVIENIDFAFELLPLLLTLPLLFRLSLLAFLKLFSSTWRIGAVSFYSIAISVSDFCEFV